MEFSEVIRKRTAVRKFSSQIIEKEKLDMVLEAWRLAPTAKNLQPIKIYVVKSFEGLEKIDKATPCRYWAPIVLMICWDKDTAYNKENYSTYEMDACIATTHMMLEATNQWLGNIWIEKFDWNILINEFVIPNNLTPIALLPIGYKADDCPENPNHNIRKNIDKLVEYK